MNAGFFPTTNEKIMEELPYKKLSTILERNKPLNSQEEKGNKLDNNTKNMQENPQTQFTKPAESLSSAHMRCVLFFRAKNTSNPQQFNPHHKHIDAQ